MSDRVMGLAGGGATAPEFAEDPHTFHWYSICQFQANQRLFYPHRGSETIALTVPRTLTEVSSEATPYFGLQGD